MSNGLKEDKPMRVFVTPLWQQRASHILRLRRNDSNYIYIRSKDRSLSLALHLSTSSQRAVDQLCYL
ncbi:hypothetical protein AVEN_173058-1, partial [Araneus ventricosus]